LSRRRATHTLDLALRYPLFDKRLEISLRGENLLRSFRIASERFGPDFTVTYAWVPRAPRVLLSFNYRFQRGAEAKQRERMD